MKATAKELRFYSKELMNTVKRGEEVVITYRGKPCAKLIPYQSTKEKKRKDNVLFGIWKENQKVKDVEAYIRELRKERF